MAEQKRWFCKTCRREWIDVSSASDYVVGIEPWEPADGCMACHREAASERRRLRDLVTRTPEQDERVRQLDAELAGVEHTIELVTYQPAFPGADIQRQTAPQVSAGVLHLVPPLAEITAPPLVLVVPPQPDPPIDAWQQFI